MMYKAIGSKVDLSVPSGQAEQGGYYELVADLLESEAVQQMKQYTHHGHTTCFQHCLNVSYYNYLFCKLLSLDARAGARAGLLHDLFLYDWHTHITPKGERNHCWSHAGRALANARENFEISPVEADIISKHMFPMNIKLPSYRETWVIIFTDKMCGAWEVMAHWGFIMKRLAAYPLRKHRERKSA